MTRPGQSHWECSEDVFTSGEPDEASRRASLARMPKITTSMQPPTAEEARLMQLQRCHRVMPQDNDTGGFFVAVLQLLPESVPTDPAYLAVSGSGTAAGKVSKKGKQEEVSAEASMEIMRNLGYNPKHTTLKGAARGADHHKEGGEGRAHKKRKGTPVITATSAADGGDSSSDSEGERSDGEAAVGDGGLDVPTVYEDLKDSEVQHVCAALGLNECRVAGSRLPAAVVTGTESRYYLMRSTHQPTSSGGASTSAAEEVDKKTNKFAGIFGTKATGWVKPVEVAAESTGMAIVPLSQHLITDAC